MAQHVIDLEESTHYSLPSLAVAARDNARIGAHLRELLADVRASMGERMYLDLEAAINDREATAMTRLVATLAAPLRLAVGEGRGPLVVTIGGGK